MEAGGSSGGWPVEPGEERVELRRYLDALRRSARLIVLIVGVITLGVLLASMLLPKSYQATARLALAEPASPLERPDAESAQRLLATVGTFVTSPAVLERASGRLDGKSTDELEDQVESVVDQDANVIEITASEGGAQGAAATTNAVALAFLAERRALQRRELSRQRKSLQREIDSLDAVAPEAGAPDPSDVRGQLRALRQRVNELRIQEATAGSDLQLVEPATPPEQASSPRPLRNTVLALFASIFIAVLVALGRDQLSPRASGPREVGRVLGLPVLGGLRALRRRPGRGRGVLHAAERESYESLRNAVEVAARPGRQRVLVVTSAALGDGKTTVVARLGQSLAAAGHDTLLVSADLRRPALHDRFGLPRVRGVRELLDGASRNRRVVSKAALTRATKAIRPRDYGGRGRVKLHVLASGKPPPDPAKVLAGDVVESLFDQIRRLDYEYVLVDAPPLLDVVDAQVLTRAADGVVLVAGLDTVTIEQLLEARDVLDRLELEPLGVVVIGAGVDHYHAQPAAESDKPASAPAGLSSRGRGPPQRPGPHERRDDPQVAPVKRVDEQAVGEQPTPRTEQRR
jgi:capsular exopolysaccharide synthesis family protein